MFKATLSFVIFGHFLSVVSKIFFLRKESKLKKLLINRFTELVMNVLRKIFDPVKENGVWIIRNNQELMDRYGEPDIISEIIKGRLQWLGHMERLARRRTVKKVFKDIPEGKKKVRWKAKKQMVGRC